jgi:transposase
VTLNDLVPLDSFYRHLEQSLDLSFVRDLVREAYAETGRPSIDPVIFFKLQLILFFEGLRSERQLLEVVADRLSLRWYLGYDLTESLPDHSSLSRIRQRYGLDVFRRFFETIVEQCLAAGLVWGQELYLDATKVAADAALASLQPRFAVEAHLAQLFADNDAVDNGDENNGNADEAGTIGPWAMRPNDLTEPARSEPISLVTTGSAGLAGLTVPSAAARIGARPISASAPPIPMPRRCQAATAERGWVTRTTTWSMAAGRASSSLP